MVSEVLKNNLKKMAKMFGGAEKRLYLCSPVLS